MQHITDDDLLGSTRTEQMLGISASTRIRWRMRPELGFPDPIVVLGRQFWRRGDLIAWQMRMRAIGGETQRGPAGRRKAA